VPLGDTDYLAEVKARAHASGWKSLKKWLGKNDLLFLVEDREQPLVVLPWDTYKEFLARMEAGGGDDDCCDDLAADSAYDGDHRHGYGDEDE
jgi:hypothetical protein